MLPTVSVLPAVVQEPPPVSNPTSHGTDPRLRGSHATARQHSAGTANPGSKAMCSVTRLCNAARLLQCQMAWCIWDCVAVNWALHMDSSHAAFPWLGRFQLHGTAYESSRRL